MDDPQFISKTQNFNQNSDAAALIFEEFNCHLLMTGFDFLLDSRFQYVANYIFDQNSDATALIL